METIVKDKFKEILSLDTNLLAEKTGLKPKEVHQSLMEESEDFQRNQKIRRVKNMRSYSANNFGELIQADLMFLSTPTNSAQTVKITGTQFKYAVIAVDVWSRMLFVRLVRSKRSSEVGAALNEIFKEMRDKYYNGSDYFKFKLLVDGGTEFSQSTLDKNVALIRSHSKYGASIAERYIRTLRDKIRLLTGATNALTQDQFFQVVETINEASKSTVSTPGYSAKEIVEGWNMKPDKIIKVHPEPDTYRYPLGGYVRIVNFGEKFDRVFVKKSAFNNYTAKIFSIYERSLDQIQNIPLYTVVSLDGNYISKRVWYEEELLWIPTSYVRKLTNDERDEHEDFTPEELKVFQLESVD